MRLKLRPVTLREACDFIDSTHRHNRAPRGWKFGVGLEVGGRLVGVGTAGRPVARLFDDGKTLEINRVCTDGTRNACSMIYGALRRAARALGYERVITYTLETESGASLRAAGWRKVKETSGGTWNRGGRRRKDVAPLCPKILWESC